MPAVTPRAVTACPHLGPTSSPEWAFRQHLVPSRQARAGFFARCPRRGPRRFRVPAPLRAARSPARLPRGPGRRRAVPARVARPTCPRAVGRAATPPPRPRRRPGRAGRGTYRRRAPPSGRACPRPRVRARSRAALTPGAPTGSAHGVGAGLGEAPAPANRRAGRPPRRATRDREVRAGGGARGRGDARVQVRVGVRARGCAGARAGARALEPGSAAARPGLVAAGFRTELTAGDGGEGDGRGRRRRSSSSCCSRAGRSGVSAEPPARQETNPGRASRRGCERRGRGESRRSLLLALGSLWVRNRIFPFLASATTDIEYNKNRLLPWKFETTACLGCSEDDVALRLMKKRRGAKVPPASARPGGATCAPPEPGRAPGRRAQRDAGCGARTPGRPGARPARAVTAALVRTESAKHSFQKREPRGPAPRPLGRCAQLLQML